MTIDVMIIAAEYTMHYHERVVTYYYTPPSGNHYINITTLYIE